MFGLVIAALRGREENSKVFFYRGLANVLLPIGRPERLVERPAYFFDLLRLRHVYGSAWPSLGRAEALIDNATLCDILLPSVYFSKIGRYIASGDGSFFEDGGGKPPCVASRPLSSDTSCNIRSNASPEIVCLLHQKDLHGPFP